MSLPEARDLAKDESGRDSSSESSVSSLASSGSGHPLAAEEAREKTAETVPSEESQRPAPSSDQAAKLLAVDGFAPGRYRLTETLEARSEPEAGRSLGNIIWGAHVGA